MPILQFEDLSEESNREVFKTTFQKVVGALIGEAAAAERLRQLASDDGFNIFIGKVGDDPMAVMGYRKKLVHDKDRGLFKSFEIVAFYVIDAKRDCYKTFGAQMCRYLISAAKTLMRGHVSSMHMDVPSAACDLISFLERRQFQGKPAASNGSRLLVREFGQRFQAPSEPASAETPTSRKRGREAEDLPSSDTKRLRPGRDHGKVPVMMKYLQMIHRGDKTVEARIHSGPFKLFKEGDRVTFFCRDLYVPCLVQGVGIYKTFSEMLKEEGVAKCLPDVHDLDEAVRIYNNIPGYAERVKTAGVIAIRVQKQ